MRSTIFPGGTVGIIGGGVEGRAIALAARALGYRVRVLDADESCLVEPLAERAIRAPLHQARAAVEVLGGCDVVTASVEHVPPRTLLALEHAGAVLRPGASLVALAQDRVRERQWLAANGFPLLPWRAVDTLEQAVAALTLLGDRGVLKPALRDAAVTGGPGVRRVGCVADLVDALGAASGARFALETEADIDAELAVVVARTSGGALTAYPVSESRRVDRDGVPRLRWSVLPSTLPRQHVERARRLATEVAEQLRLEGMLSVEMFLLTDGRLVVNELVPCPHPTFAAAGQACTTGQYEQLVRAICGLPLGDTAVVCPVAIAPVHADEWPAGDAQAIVRALRLPGIALHVHGVYAPSPGQRLGHLAAAGSTPGDAIARVMAARDAFVAAGGDGLSVAACLPDPSGDAGVRAPVVSAAR